MIPIAKWTRSRISAHTLRLHPAATPASTAAASGASCLKLGSCLRMVLMLTPSGRGTFGQQAEELLNLLRAALKLQPVPMTVTLQTVFLRQPEDQPECERLLAHFHGAATPVTNYVLQPPCCGAALAVEAWAVGGPEVRVERFSPQVLAVSYNQVRWTYCGGICPGPVGGAYGQTSEALAHLHARLASAASGFEHVVRTWFYLGNITGPDAGARKPDTQRYQEFNRARTDYYRGIKFCSSLPHPNIPHGIYPASTGIGTSGNTLMVSCLSLQTERQDALLLPLENPQQTPAYAYPPRYSSQSPKFSRAVALVLGNQVTTWISGTASIVNSESCHRNRLDHQVEQTLDNIERLIAPENFLLHGLTSAGARLTDLANIRVYLRHAEDLPRCRTICERRLGAVPAIYTVANICRPELLVEVEGVAFSEYSPGPRTSATESTHGAVR